MLQQDNISTQQCI